jgi:hypothetical protein
MKRSKLRALELARSHIGRPVNGSDFVAAGAGHDATRRVRELRADPDLELDMVPIRTESGRRWDYVPTPRSSRPDGQLALWREPRGQLELGLDCE